MFRDIKIKDLMLFYQVSESTAKKRMKELKDYYKKNRVSVYDLAVYEGYQINEVMTFLGV